MMTLFAIPSDFPSPVFSQMFLLVQNEVRMRISVQVDNKTTSYYFVAMRDITVFELLYRASQNQCSQPVSTSTPSMM